MANPFQKKTWQRRLTQFPTRRTLTDTTSGNVQTVDVARAEGQIYEAGDGFTDANMNDLEDRIEEAFDEAGGNATHLVPRAIPKDLTEYYQDGTLFRRLHGTNGFEKLDDIYVGDYFQMSRAITAYDYEASQLSTEEGTSWVTIVDITPNINLDGISGKESLILMPGLPYDYDDGYRILHHNFDSHSHFGVVTKPTTGECYYNTTIAQYVIGAPTNEGSIADNATISQKLYYEFGSHLCTLEKINNEGQYGGIPVGTRSDNYEFYEYELFTLASRKGTKHGGTNINGRQAICPSEFEMVGFPTVSNSSVDLRGIGHINMFKYLPYDASNVQVMLRTSPKNDGKICVYQANDNSIIYNPTRAKVHIVPYFAVS